MDRNPYFSTPERLQRLQAAAAQWRGTPFGANSCSIGQGVSCQHLAAAILRAAGACDLKPPDVPMAHAEFCATSLVEPWMDRQTVFRSVPTKDLAPGDVLGFRLRRVIHHVGVCIAPGAFVHAMQGLGVTVAALADPTWRNRLVRVWRPMEG